MKNFEVLELEPNTFFISREPDEATKVITWIDSVTTSGFIKSVNA